MVLYFLSCHGYDTLLVLGKDIPLEYVSKRIFLSIVLFKSNNHIFLSIVLFNLSCKLTYLRSDNSLLM